MGIENRDFNETIRLVHKHGERVGILAYRLSQRLDLPEEFWFMMYIAGRWHDYGKMLVPMEILNKSGRLNADEFAVMKDHPVASYALLKMCNYHEEINTAIMYHHEDFCGTGYPASLVEQEIPIGARILRICDVFDALTEERIYKEGLPVRGALAVMDKDNTKGIYDPHIYEVFKEMVFEEEEDDHARDYTGRLNIVPGTGGEVILQRKDGKGAC